MLVHRFVPNFLTFVLMASAPSTMNAENLDQLRWKKRVVILYVPAGAAGQLARQEQLFRSHDAELKERDVTQIVVRSRAENPEIAERFNFAGTGFALVLVGKDGGEKLRSGDVVSPEMLFRLIDSMPMRQEEMAKRQRTSAKAN